ncbi:osmotically inducible protein C [Thiomicrorhabdus immobilis]|uniref:Osmotically inducible protein C n=1 Tax=Thiomicrorhabdus immobilis TaxID=2791037 RepID=A0ABM7MB40_9GAMM|nr:OsmC family protein [Thiomicrorhabdus immobilis]BCN92545.1 osmotically inducible protein C [Thiomicrorhabdus immobilis]
MSISVKWQGGKAFEATSSTGHKVMMDASKEVGGEDKGSRPMELLLMGLGGCSGIDVILMLEKGKQDVKDCQMEITSERADSVPAVYTKIHLHFKVFGSDLNQKKVARAVELSAEKYCSVSKMLEKTAEMTHTYEIVEV